MMLNLELIRRRLSAERFALILVSACLALGALGQPNTVWAQKKTDAAAEQRRAEQLRKLSAQNQQLEADKAKLVKEKEEAEAGAKLIETKVKTAQGQSSRLSRELNGLRVKLAEQEKVAQANVTEIQKLKSELVALKEVSTNQQAQIEQRVQTISSLNANISTLNANNNRLSTQVRNLEETVTGQRERQRTVSSELGTCAKNNVSLVALVDEVSERYRKKTCVDARSIVEPLVGLRRAEFERVAEEYRSKASEERYLQPVVKP